VLGGSHDHRVDRDMLQRWEPHTSNAFTLLMFDGGHFYVNEHTDAVAELVNG
jgi:surfactin synthase thioesterase subunit